MRDFQIWAGTSKHSTLGIVKEEHLLTDEEMYKSFNFFLKKRESKTDSQEKVLIKTDFIPMLDNKIRHSRL